MGKLVCPCLLLLGVAVHAATPEEILKDAQGAEKAGSVQKAVDLYSQFLRENPDHSQVIEARYRLGKDYDALGMVDESIAQLKLATADEKKNFRNRPDAFLSLAKLYASGKKYEEAAAALEKMLADGPGLFEDEALNLAGGYYAILGKYDNAAAKFNILRRRGDANLAEQAAYKLAMLWLRAEKMDAALLAIQDLGNSFPKNQQVPELMLRAADELRKKQQFDKTISICEQIKQRYPKVIETLGANYLLGLCYRDRKEHQKAADALDNVGRSREAAARAIAAEAILQSAEIYFKELHDTDKAMARYDEAAKLARDSEGERKTEILEQCYFRLAENQYQKKNYGAALDYYSLMRATGTRVNIFGRILECQAQLNKTSDTIAPETVTEADVDLLKKKIADSPGTAQAAEAEIFLLDRRFSDLARRRNGNVTPLAAEYEKLATTYSKEVLATQSMGAYLWQMTGLCYAAGNTQQEMSRAIAAFEKVIAFDNSDNNPYRQPALENIALCAERAGDKNRAAKAYADLIELSKKQLEAKKDDKAVEQKTLEYLKSLATRSDTPDLMNSTIELTKKLIEEKGPLSDLSRESRFYLGELYYLKKDFSNSAKTFREFIQIYGPKLDQSGDVSAAPWKPARVDEKTLQVYEAAIRIAHAWYMQGHDQNMVKAYDWIVRNIPHQNRHMAEAQYWLAMELLKGKEGETKDRKKQAAEALWKNVVHPTLPSPDAEESRFRKSYHFWVGDEDTAKYVKNAMMRAGQLFGEVEDHETAAGCFNQYLAVFGSTSPSKNKPRTTATRDEMLDIARYALGREYIALKRISKMLDAYKPYLTGHRDDRFRISGLRLMAHHAAQENMVNEAMEAYATLLDEYGDNRTDERGRVIPVSSRDRLRQGNTNWDGIKLAPPRGLDLGEVRYALGFLYWKNDDFTRCSRSLAPFLTDPALKESKSRGQALFMAGQSFFKLYDYPGAAKTLRALVKDYPKFEAIEEAYVWAARASVETKEWPDLELLCRNFINEWPKSDRRTRMDLYAALAQGGHGRTDAAKSALRSLAKSDTYEDVKADAWYHLALYTVSSNPSEAMTYFDSSLAYPRESSLLEAGKCAVKLNELEKAKGYLERAAAAKGDPAIIAQAKDLLSTVNKQLVKKGK